VVKSPAQQNLMPKRVMQLDVGLGEGDGLGLASGVGVVRTAERVLLAEGEADAVEDLTGLPLPSGLPLLCPRGLVRAGG
jgi:hypothetical protein